MINVQFLKIRIVLLVDNILKVVYIHFYDFILNDLYLSFWKQESHGILYQILTKPNKPRRDSIFRHCTALMFCIELDFVVMIMSMGAYTIYRHFQ